LNICHSGTVAITIFDTPLVQPCKLIEVIDFLGVSSAIFKSS
jgi:hypothetical protein